jgi:uncharacterized protein (TIGR00255 family)
MTGAGFAAGDSEIGPVRIDVRSVNGRGLSVKLRLSSACSGFESAIEERVRGSLGRGSVLVIVERTSSPSSLPDRDTLRTVAAEMRELADELQLQQPSLMEVMQAASGGSSRSEAATSRPLPAQLRALLETAVEQLLAHRHKEGAGTVSAIVEQLDEFVHLTDVAAKRAPHLIEEYKTRLLQRVQEFIASNLPSPPPAVDLVREVAVFSDRVDVAEEFQRLRAHTDEVKSLLHKGGEVGRRLEFLLQELLRETNTLGSKSPDTEVAHTVVAMKSCIATIKEQVANLE